MSRSAHRLLFFAALCVIGPSGSMASGLEPLFTQCGPRSDRFDYEQRIADIAKLEGRSAIYPSGVGLDQAVRGLRHVTPGLLAFDIDLNTYPSAAAFAGAERRSTSCPTDELL